MSNFPNLSYQISSWKQLTKCLSNNSRLLHIAVTDFVQNECIEGLRISVEHASYGILFSCMVGAKGNLITDSSSELSYELTPAQILNNLQMFGFNVQYNPLPSLPGNMIAYLVQLSNLKFDKLRTLRVRDLSSATGSYSTYVVGFLAERIPGWLDAGYSPSKDEFVSQLECGSAWNVSAISSELDLDWTWLDNMVVSIDDVLEEYSECRCNTK